MNSVPIDWLEKLRDSAKEFGFTEHYIVLDMIVRMWQSRFFEIPETDDTHCFQTSCLQDLTPFARSMGLSNDKSVWWLDIYMDDKGNPVKISQELETFGKKLVKRG